VAEAIAAFGRSNCGGTVRAGSFRFATVALALALLHAAPLYAEEEKANLYEEEGARLFVAKSYEGAIKQYSQAYRLDPQPRYLFNIGQAYRRMGLAAEATEYYQRYLTDEPKPDATIRADLVGYMEQYYASLEGKERPRFSNEPEPAPFLAAEELLDAEELIAQYVRDYKAGNNAAATELMDQLMQVLAKRRDPILYYYIASGFDQVKRKSDALSYYKKFMASDPADATLRSRSAARIDDLTPPPPGQKYLWPSLALGIPGLAGVLTGAGLFVRSQGNFTEFQNAASEQEKRALRERGQPLAIGSTVAYAVGGGLLTGAAIFAIVAVKKGIRQPAQTTTPGPRLDTQKTALTLIPNGIGFTLGGSF